MAPSRTPGRNKREPDYSRIGVEGRKTGVTLKDTGIRDEHGLEPIDGIFSSPEKSPVKRNGTALNSTIEEEEEDMDIGQSTIPEPIEVLSARRNGKPILPPPHARSPIKTTLNSSPRRSVGPMSSPIRQSNNATPSRAASHPLIGRRLDFSEESRKSTELSPLPARSTVSPSPAVKSSKLGRPLGKNKKRVFDLSLEDDDIEEQEGDGRSGKDTANINRQESSRHVEEDFHPYDDSVPNIEDESLHINGNDMLEGDEQTQLTADSLPEEKQYQVKAKRGRPPKHAEAKSIQDESSRLDDDAASSARAAKRAGRPRKSATTDADNSLVDQQVDQPKGKRGRKPKGEVFQDDVDEEETGPLKGSKRPRIDPTELSSAETNVKAGKTKAKKPPPSERDPNAKIVAAKRKGKAPSVEPAGRFARPRSRGLTILRTGTPAEDDGARVLKTGRTSVKPIAYWRNERIVYGEMNMDGKDLVLPAIKEVIRTDEIIETRPKYSYRRRGATVRSRSHALEEVEEEEDEDQEEWEADPGYLHTEVLRWDSETERGLEEVHEEVDLALAPVALEGLSREVKGAKFMYAKTITLPFFHSGMVDIPPGGEKKTKNSRKNHMVFWVFSGRVQVKVADTSFSIGRGGMWQVPRGNLYSIANVYTRPSRIFFAQGCFMTPEDVEEEEAVPATAE